MSYSSDDEYDFLESIERRNSIRYEAEKMLIQERNNKELQDLNAQIGEIDEKLKKLEEKFKDKKVGEFNGYKDLAMPTEQITQNGVVIKDEELSQNKKMLFEAVANGDLTQIDLYLEAPGLNLETTLYCENLLMCSIRNERQTMAEYLIVRGVNVDYEANLIEFNGNQPSPIKHVKYSCREMAYDHKMWKLVDLIDIFSQSTDKRIVKYISRRYVNELESFQPVETKPESLGNVKILLAKQPQSNVDSKEGSIKEENEEELEKEIEYTKPASRQGINDDSSEIAKVPLVITEEFVANKLREKIIEKVKSLVDVRPHETDGDKKCFLYNNFKVNLLMKRKDSVESTRLRNRGYSQTILDINSSKDVEIENIITLEENKPNKSKRGTKVSTDRKFSVDSVNKSKSKNSCEGPKVVDFIKIPVCESEDNRKFKNNRRKTVRF